ncbi:hypothetical protein PG988_010192 [Apiospora saccharicola]
MATPITPATDSVSGAVAVARWNINRREEATTTSSDGTFIATGTDWKQSQGVPPASSTTGGSPRTLPTLPGNYDSPSPSISTAGSSQDQEGQPQQPKSPSSSSSSQDDTSGTATTIGISAGVSVAVVLLIIGAVLLVVRRRRRGRGRGRRSSSFSAGDEREEYLATGPAPAHLLYPTGMEQLQPQPQQQQQQQQDHPQWWTEEEMPAHLAPATTKIRPCELTDGSPYQRAVAEMGGGWQR